MLCARVGKRCGARRGWNGFVILRFWLALFGLANLWRAILFLQQWRDLPALATAFNPVYLAMCGFLWGMGFLVVAARGLRLKNQVARVTILFMLAYLAHQWANFLLLGRNSEAVAALGARALLSLFALCFTAGLSIRQLRRISHRGHPLAQ